MLPSHLFFTRLPPLLLQRVEERAGRTAAERALREAVDGLRLSGGGGYFMAPVATMHSCFAGRAGVRACVRAVAHVDGLSL